MSHSQGDFVTIVNIPEGNHEYKYIVDGNEQINSNAKISESSKNNVISVKKSDFEVFEALAMDLASNTKSNDYSNTNNGSPKGEQELFGLFTIAFGCRLDDRIYCRLQNIFSKNLHKHL